MKWTRRQILFALGGAACALGLDAFKFGALRGRLAFADWRALPGMRLGLDINTETDPSALAVDIIAVDERGEHLLATMRGARRLDVEMPFVPTQKDSFHVVAQARDWRNRRLRSEPVEVLSGIYKFGL